MCYLCCKEVCFFSYYCESCQAIKKIIFLFSKNKVLNVLEKSFFTDKLIKVTQEKEIEIVKVPEEIKKYTVKDNESYRNNLIKSIKQNNDKSKNMLQ